VVSVPVARVCSVGRLYLAGANHLELWGRIGSIMGLECRKNPLNNQCPSSWRSSGKSLLFPGLVVRLCKTTANDHGPPRLILQGMQEVSRQSPATYAQPTQPAKRPNFSCNLLNPLVDLEGFEPSTS